MMEQEQIPSEDELSVTSPFVAGKEEKEALSVTSPLILGKEASGNELFDTWKHCSEDGMKAVVGDDLFEIGFHFSVDGKKMQKVDRHSIDEVGIPSMVLMERAAFACAKRIMSRSVTPKRVLCVCGMGNNGGDGIAVARILREENWDSSVWMVGDLNKQSEQCRQQMDIAQKLSIPVHFFSSKDLVALNRMALEEYDIIVDAIFGIGLTRPVEGLYKEVIEAINSSKAHIVAIDIPSGIHAGTGQVLGVSVKAQETVTMGLMKNGLLLAPGYQYAGRVYVEQIGFPECAFVGIQPDLCYIDREQSFGYEDIVKLLPKRRSESNKGTYGRVLVISGSRGMAGAACLCAEAAYRMGCGLVRIFSEQENRIILQTRLPEAIVSTYSELEEPESLVEKLEQAIDWADSVVIGPGLGTSEAAKLLMEHAVRRMGEDGVRPLVIDADGLNILAQNPEFYGNYSGVNFILTPHLKEMERLSGQSISQIRENRMEARQFLNWKECTLVLKDARTLVSSTHECFLNTRGTNGMATGGSGDVLAGILGGILAQSSTSYWESAVRAVIVHALLGERARDIWSDHGMLAGDMVRAMSRHEP